MAGLHQCPRCGYRFEDHDSLESHMEDIVCENEEQDRG